MQVRGIPIDLHPDEGISNTIRRTKDFYESEILDSLLERYGREIGGGIIDIGANIGNHSLYFANFFRYYYIAAFEPVPDNFRLLESNLARYPAIWKYPIALGDGSIRKTRMAINNRNMGASSINKGGDLIVPIKRLDTFKFRNVALVKIDVEGYEFQVLWGSIGTLLKYRPHILIEQSNSDSDYWLRTTNYKQVMEFPYYTSLYEYVQ